MVVDGAVVAVADRQEVVEVGGAAVLPPPDVMHLGAGEPHLAARDRTRRVQGSQHSPLGGAGETLGASEVEGAGGQIATMCSRARAATSRSTSSGRSTGSPQSTSGGRRRRLGGVDDHDELGLADRSPAAGQQRDHREPGEVLLLLDRIVGAVVGSMCGEQPLDLVLDALVDLDGVERVARGRPGTSPRAAPPTTATAPTASDAPVRRRLAGGAPRPAGAARTRSPATTGPHRPDHRRSRRARPDAWRRRGATLGSPRRMGARHLAGTDAASIAGSTRKVRPRSTTRSPVLRETCAASAKILAP